jgi:hypothetical protein
MDLVTRNQRRKKWRMALERGMAEMPVRGLLIGMADPEQQVFAEAVGHELQTDRQSVRESTWQRETRDAGDIDRYRETSLRYI